jgi:hypothetical protein
MERKHSSNVIECGRADVEPLFSSFYFVKFRKRFKIFVLSYLGMGDWVCNRKVGGIHMKSIGVSNILHLHSKKDTILKRLLEVH